MKSTHKYMKNNAFFKMFKEHYKLLIETDNRKFLYLAIIYAIAVSFLTLAVPISVQMLINTVANIASIDAIVILSLILCGLLIISGALVTLQSYTLELFERRFYASMTAQFTLRNMRADQRKFRHINGNDLVNRYFDIMQVQKVIPSLIAGFFGTVLQMLVGILVVSFYHPWLLLFNLIFMFLLWLITRFWGLRAMGTAIGLSEAKYQTARHLEDVAQSNDFYKSEVRGQHAIKRTNELTQQYLQERIKHFQNTFTQKIALLILYAISSAALLGLGGILVVLNELSLGQLIAAELILSAVFFAVSRLSYYLVQFYDLSVALEEISRVYDIELEESEGTKLLHPSQNYPLIFSNVVSSYTQNIFSLNCEIQAGEKIVIKAANSSIQRCISDLLKRYNTPQSGRIIFNHQDLLDYQPIPLRNYISVIDSPNLVEASVLEYLQIHNPNASRADVNDVLRVVELEKTIDSLPQGINTLLLASGIPLKATEALRLKLAGALLGQPKILVLNELFDSLSYNRRKRIFDYICRRDSMILLYFTNRYDLDHFDRYLYLDWQHHEFFENSNALSEQESMSDE
jgi:putative ABC transport system ATP-binding protein